MGLRNLSSGSSERGSDGPVNRVGGRAIESESERIGVIHGHANRFRTHAPEQRGGRDDEALVPKAEEPGGEAFA